MLLIPNFDVSKKIRKAVTKKDKILPYFAN